MSPQALKDGLRDYARETSNGFLQTLEQRARENPLQTVAIAAGLAYPAWRLLMNIPVPILLVGAGLALSRSNGGTAGYTPASFDTAADALGRAKEATAAKVSDGMDVIKAQAGAAADRMTKAVDSTVQAGKAQMEAITNKAAAAASSASDAAAAIANKVSDGVSEAYRSGVETAAQVGDQIGEIATHSKDTVIQAIESHPLVVGAIGLAIGGFIGSALPVTGAENHAFGATSDEIKRRASKVAEEASERLTSAAQDVYQSAASRLEETGITPDSGRAVRDAGDTIKPTPAPVAENNRNAIHRGV
jgi:ElaB/YqjD/DUF883 family membrane-anchored ribosome-binding protein